MKYPIKRLYIKYAIKRLYIKYAMKRSVVLLLYTSLVLSEKKLCYEKLGVSFPEESRRSILNRPSPRNTSRGGVFSYGNVLWENNSALRTSSKGRWAVEKSRTWRLSLVLGHGASLRPWRSPPTKHQNVPHRKRPTPSLYIALSFCRMCIVCSLYTFSFLMLNSHVKIAGRFFQGKPTAIESRYLMYPV